MKPQPAIDLLARMFDVELRFLQSDKPDLRMLATAFHPDVVVHEPKSLPYAGDWIGFEGIVRCSGECAECGAI